MKYLPQRGFTLAELLIVITIISVLATMSIFVLTGNQQKARDAKRKSDIKAIQTALELYRADKGKYPTAIGDLSPTYIKQIPLDPRSSSANFTYTYFPDVTQKNYCVVTCLENKNDPDKVGVIDGPTAGIVNIAGCSSSPTCPGNTAVYYQQNP